MVQNLEWKKNGNGEYEATGKHGYEARIYTSLPPVRWKLVTQRGPTAEKRTVSYRRRGEAMDAADEAYEALISHHPLENLVGVALADNATAPTVATDEVQKTRDKRALDATNDLGYAVARLLRRMVGDGWRLPDGSYAHDTEEAVKLRSALEGLHDFQVREFGVRRVDHEPKSIERFRRVSSIFDGGAKW